MNRLSFFIFIIFSHLLNAAVTSKEGQMTEKHPEVSHTVASISENHGLSFISNQDENIYSVGISTGGIAEIRMARCLPNRYVVATTIDPEGASFAQEQIEQASLSDRIEVKIEDISKPLPYEDDVFDFVYARLVLHYLSKNNLRSALQELYRILKPTGSIFVVVRSTACLEAQEGYCNPETGMTSYTSKKGNIYSRYFHTEESICDFLTSAGFHITHVKTYDEQLCIDFKRSKPSDNIDNLIEVYVSK